MAIIDRETLLELVRNRPLLAVELLRDAVSADDQESGDEEAGDEEAGDRQPLRRRRSPWQELLGTNESDLAARYREIVAEGRRSRAHLGEDVFEGLIAFLNARIGEGLNQAHLAAEAGDPEWHKAERDLAAKRERVMLLESVLVNELYLSVEEHAQAEHLLKLEASAYSWHTDYQDEWRP